MNWIISVASADVNQNKKRNKANSNNHKLRSKEMKNHQLNCDLTNRDRYFCNKKKIIKNCIYKGK